MSSPRESPAAEPNSPTWERISKNSACGNHRSPPVSSPGAAAGHEGTGKAVRENVCDAHTRERDDATFPACDFHLWAFLQTHIVPRESTGWRHQSLRTWFEVNQNCSLSTAGIHKLF